MPESLLRFAISVDFDREIDALANDDTDKQRVDEKPKFAFSH